MIQFATFTVILYLQPPYAIIKAFRPPAFWMATWSPTQWDEFGQWRDHRKIATRDTLGWLIVIQQIDDRRENEVCKMKRRMNGQYQAGS